MTHFTSNDIKTLKKALENTKALGAGGEPEGIANRWNLTEILPETVASAAPGEEVFAHIQNTEGDAWVETTDAVYIRRKETGKWWNLSAFLRGDVEEPCARLPEEFPVLAAELALNDRQSLHIAHIHAEEWRIEKITEGLGEAVIAERSGFLGISPNDENYEILYKTYWGLQEGLPRQICSRFLGFRSLDKGDAS